LTTTYMMKPLKLKLSNMKYRFDEFVKGKPKFDNTIIKFYENFTLDKKNLCSSFSEFIIEEYSFIECSDLTGCCFCPFDENYVDDIDTYLIEYKLGLLKL
jgi:hypothetical protein